MSDCLRTSSQRAHPLIYRPQIEWAIAVPSASSDLVRHGGRHCRPTRRAWARQRAHRRPLMEGYIAETMAIEYPNRIRSMTSMMSHDRRPLRGATDTSDARRAVSQDRLPRAARKSDRTSVRAAVRAASITRTFHSTKPGPRPCRARVWTGRTILSASPNSPRLHCFG